MDEMFFPCTVANPRGARRQAGLMGSGNSSFPSEIASRAFPSQNFAGYYATSDYNAAMFLAHELASPDTDISTGEAQEYVQLLRSLLRRLRTAKDVSVDALKKLQEMAESIPEIGPLMFSPANLPGTFVSAGTVVAAISNSKSVVDLLDMTAADKNKLVKWASNRGTSTSQSAKKAFKGKIKLIRVGGQLHFEVPITAQAHSYKVLGQVGRQVAHIPAFGTRSALNSRAMLHAEGGTRGLKIATGNVVGIALAVGPQAYFDYTSSASMNEFYRKSVYSQPTNVASFAGGVAGSIAVGMISVGIGAGAAPLVLIVAVGWLAGLGVQALMSGTGVDKSFGDYLTKNLL